jgi:hypothetical protein
VKRFSSGFSRTGFGIIADTSGGIDDDDRSPRVSLTFSFEIDVAGRRHLD